MPDLIGTKIAYLGFCGPIDANSVTKIAGVVNAAVNQQYDEITLCFSSNGGYIGDGVYLYHHLRSLHIPLTIYNTGTVASIATTLFVGAETRYCSPNSIFMMHPVAMPSGQSATALQCALEAALHDEERTERILRERTSIPEQVLLDRRSREVFITPHQALQYGLVNEIRDFTLPPGNQIVQI